MEVPRAGTGWFPPSSRQEGRGVDPRRSGLLATRTGVCESQRLVSETQVRLPHSTAVCAFIDPLGFRLFAK